MAHQIRSQKEKYLFGSLFSFSTKLQAIFDSRFAQYDMTTKQWLLTIVADGLFETPPSLTELAEAMGSTYQNVKQLALKLEKKDFLEICNDEEDRRVIRLRLTNKNYVFWLNRQEEAEEFLKELFSTLTEEEINTICKGLNKLYQRILEINKNLN
ncbi:MAG: MarR family winged helix-turn-helix transcriptional regulator [Bacillota bacterium]